MAKKEVEVKEELVEKTLKPVELHLDFGREDLNALRDKLNEVIRWQK